jgi:hypothetical protein
MKMKPKNMGTAFIAGLFILGGMDTLIAQEADTNATTVAYWKLSGASSIPENPVTGVGIPDLATNAGQGTLANASIVPASVQNLWFEGSLASAPTFVSDVPPTSMFNANNYF